MEEYTLNELKSKAREFMDYIYEFSRVNQPNIFKNLDGHIEMFKKSTDYAKDNSNEDPSLRIKIERVYSKGWMDCTKFMEEYKDK